MASESKRSGESESDDVLFERAVAAHESGLLEQAETLYRRVLARAPNDAVVLELLGQVLIGVGRCAEAAEQLARSVAADPTSAGAWFARATALDTVGEQAMAEAACTEALQVDPHLTGARVLLAGLLIRRGAVAEGVSEVERVLSVPQLAEIELRSAAKSALSVSEHRLAARALMRIEAPDEADASAMLDLSSRLFEAGDHGAMDALLRHLHRLQPGNVDAARALSAHLANHRQDREAIAVLETTLARCPSASSLRHALLELHHRLGDHDSVGGHRAVLGREDGGWGLEWGDAARALRPCYSTETEILECRSALLESLRNAEAALDLRTAPRRLEALEAIRSTSFFMLPAQGLNDRDVAMQLGRTVATVLSSIAPDVMEPPHGSAESDGRIRVGVLSGFFRNHSNWKSHLGWLGMLDRSRFETIAFATQPGHGKIFRLARRRYDRLEVVRDDPIAIARRIRDERLHAVVIPEVGMDPSVRVVAAARLAPLQIASWGHPVTSGYASCNWFLSSALMEPSDAQEHYSERLLRLAGIGFRPEAPERDVVGTRRSEVARDPARVRFWCCQAPHKYLPRHDWMFAEIASRLPQAEFCFVAVEDLVRDTLSQRLNVAFSNRGLEMTDHVRWLPRCSPAEFLAIGASMDVFLDCPAWSGCNTALDSVWAGTPIVAMDGPLMRARHASAMLRVMGLGECVAADVEGLVELACRAGADAAWRRHLSESIEGNRHRLETLHDPVVEFERFLASEIETGG